MSDTLDDNKEELLVQTSDNEQKKKRNVKVIRKFPYHTIEESLAIPNMIKQNNGGKPLDNDQLSSALNLARKGNPFYYITAASRDYGFTKGSRDTINCELSDFGNKYEYAKSEEEEVECLKTAFFNIEIFKRVYDYYDGNEPEDDSFFKNTLKSIFQIDESLHEDFIKIYRANKLYCNKHTNKKSLINISASNQIKPSSIDINSKKLFVIMPFSEKTDKYPKGFFNEVFRQLIIKGASAVGFIAETANRDGSDIIHSTIVKEIANSSLILADLTEHNPNVLFELGLAIALKKPVVLIKTETTGQIFDIDNTIRVLTYNPNLWPSTLEKDIPNLSRKIETVVNNIGTEKSYLDTFLGTNAR